MLVLLTLLTAACTTVESNPVARPVRSSAKPSAFDEQPRTKVVAVLDGRTVELADGTKARISHLAQPSSCAAAAAVEFATNTLLDKEVRASSITPGEVSLILSDGVDYALLAVRNGVLRTEGVDGGPLTEAESIAAKAKLGMWAQECATSTPPKTPPPPVTPPPPPPAATTTTTPPPPPPPPCAVTYKVKNKWPGAFQAEVTVRNVSGVLIDGWTLRWRFTDGQTVSQMWNGTPTQDGVVVTVVNASYTALITPGGTVSVGFNGATKGANSVPTSFTLNGAACTSA